YLYWRDATISAVREEAHELDLDPTMVNEALAVVRTGSDGSIVRMVRAFDNERTRLQRELKREQARLAFEALHDALTGLPNRKLFFDRLAHALARSVRKTFATAVIFIDIDDFKSVNDKHGHLVGDQLLTAIGSRLLDNVRASDTVARLGGDEFVVLCEDLLSPTEETAVILERLRSLFTRPFDIENGPITVGASFGLSFTTDRDDADTLLTQADHA